MKSVLIVLGLEVLIFFAFLYAKGQKLPDTLKVKGLVRKYPLRLQRSLQYKSLQEVGFLLLAPGAVIPEHPHDNNNEAYLRVTLKGLKLINVCHQGGEHHLSNETGKFMLVIYTKWANQ